MPGTYTNLLYHIVFSTKNRLPLISTAFRDELHRYVGGIVHGEGGILLAIGGVPDHLHLLVKFKPTITVSDMLRRIKANSSKWINEEKLRLRKFGWQDGYAAFSVSESQVPRIRSYIDGQEAHHLRIDFKQELLALLDRHKVHYDPRYLWD